MSASGVVQVGRILEDLKKRAAAPVVVQGPGALAGVVHVQGAKNTALKVIPALAGFPAVFRLGNVPMIIDTLELLAILEFLGADVEVDAERGTVRVDATTVVNRPIPYELTRSTTTAFYFAGALLGRFGSVEIGKPGGDEIGARPVDLHVQAFREIGAHVEDEATSVRARLGAVPVGCDVAFRLPSAGAAVNTLLAVAAAGGSVTVSNVPADADMSAFYRFLGTCGVTVRQWAGGVGLTGHGMPTGHAAAFDCPPDRNDSFTWLAAGALSRDGIEIHGVDVDDLAAGLDPLRRLGVGIERTAGDVLVVRRPGRGLRMPEGFVVEAGASPGFHSDWAPLLHLVMATAAGSGRTVDPLFDDRVRQAVVLREMGADVTIAGGPPPAGVEVHFRTPVERARYIVDIRGPAALRAIDADVGNDVRACATAVLAATAATGTSRLGQVYALHRGYSNFLGRLRSLGATVDVEG